MDQIKQMVTHAVDENAVAFRDILQDIIAGKVSDSLEERRQQIATKLFATEESKKNNKDVDDGVSRLLKSKTSDEQKKKEDRETQAQATTAERKAYGRAPGY